MENESITKREKNPTNTYRKYEILALCAALIVRARGEFDGPFHDGLCQLVCRPALKRPSAKEELIDADAQTPVVHVPCVALAYNQRERESIRPSLAIRTTAADGEPTYERVSLAPYKPCCQLR